MRYSRLVGLIALSGALYAACGGGGSGPTSPTAGTGNPGPATMGPGPAPAPGRPPGEGSGGGEAGSGGGAGGGGGSSASLNTVRFRTLTVSVSPAGSGTVSDDLEAQGSTLRRCADCTERYRVGTRVVLAAEPAPGFAFDRWHGGDCEGRTSPSCVVTIDRDLIVTARFQ